MQVIFIIVNTCYSLPFRWEINTVLWTYSYHTPPQLETLTFLIAPVFEIQTNQCSNLALTSDFRQLHHTHKSREFKKRSLQEVRCLESNPATYMHLSTSPQSGTSCTKQTHQDTNILYFTKNFLIICILSDKIWKPINNLFFI